MTFDIHLLDDVDPGSSDDEQLLEQDQDELLDLFFQSPEGQAHREKDPEMGFWSARLIYYGYSYIGETIPGMTVASTREIITDIFPRKITLPSQEEARGAIPELIAFWQYLKREYRLPNADAILKFLAGVETKFPQMMMDSSKFGMAKSFMMMGQQAGFDMTDKEQIDQFMKVYNARILASQSPSSQPLPPAEAPGFLPAFIPPLSEADRKKAKAQKKREKMAKASRKRNRSKRK